MLRSILRKIWKCFGSKQNEAEPNYVDNYVKMVSPDAPWVYISYIADVFYHQTDEQYLSAHQNKKEALSQVEVFQQLGYNVYVQDYNSKQEIPDTKFDIIFGHEPNFVKACIKNPSALKILYVPGAYIGHRNNQIVKITDLVNEKYHCSIPYRRLLEFEDSNYASIPAYEIADQILMIGSRFTIQTFPEHLRNKITTIHQSSQVHDMDVEPLYAQENEYFFMGSYGNLLKGISLLLEYFSKHPEFILHIVGPIEDDVKGGLSSITTDNVILHGYLNVNSIEFKNIICRCNFIIYPSGSEGMPGAVLNSMKNGLIPIVTPWAAFDEIEDYGYVMRRWDVDSIGEGINWSLSLSQLEVAERKKRCVAYVQTTYNLEQYKKEFSTYFTKAIAHT